MNDLFGQEVREVVISPYTGKAHRKPTARSGYAAQPGTGPAGETCGSCKSYVRRGGHSKAYLKCLLMQQLWTNGPGTDILARSPACKKWETRTNE